MRLQAIALASALPFLACCPSSSSMPKPDNFPSADEFVASIEGKQAAASSFRALDTRMDYRDNNQRIKTTVLVMGERGAKVRVNALDPSGVTAKDLACDGINFAYVDFTANCQLVGPCTSDNIAALLRVSLEPDDFLTFATGTVPLLADATANVEWNSKNGTAVLKLLARDNSRTQEIVLDGKDATYDVLHATVRDAKGGVDWKLENKDFAAAKDAAGSSFRVPGKTRFEQPKDEGDLKIRWNDRELNVDIGDDKFVMEPPAGLPRCGQKNSSPPAAANAPPAANPPPAPNPSGATNTP